MGKRKGTTVAELPPEIRAALDRALTEARDAGLTEEAAAIGEPITGEDLVGAIVELSRQTAELAKGYDVIRREQARKRVGKLIRRGRILPGHRDLAVKLAMTSPEDFDALVAGGPGGDGPED